MQSDQEHKLKCADVNNRWAIRLTELSHKTFNLLLSNSVGISQQIEVCVVAHMIKMFNILQPPDTWWENSVWQTISPDGCSLSCCSSDGVLREWESGSVFWMRSLMRIFFCHKRCSATHLNLYQCILLLYVSGPLENTPSISKNQYLFLLSLQCYITL